MDGSFSTNPFEGEKTRERLGSLGTFLAEATPLVGDAMAAEEIYEEIKKPNPNYFLIGALGGAAILGLIPFVGDAAARAIRAGARNRMEVPTGLKDDPQGYFSEDMNDLGPGEFLSQMNRAERKRIDDYLEKGRFQPPPLEKKKVGDEVEVSAPYDATTEAILGQYGKGNITSQEAQKLMKKRGLQVNLRGKPGLRDEVYPSVSRLKEGEVASGTEYDFAEGGNVSPTISPKIADLLVKKHGFKMQENKLLGPSGTLIPVAMHEGGVVHTHGAGGQEIRTLDEASGYGGQQYTVDEKGAFTGLYTPPAPSDVGIGPSADFKSAQAGYLANQAAQEVPAPPPQMQTMNVAPATFSGDPVSAPPPQAPTPPPVAPAAPPPAPGPGGVIATDAPAAPPAAPPAVPGFQGDPGFLESDFYKNLPSFGTMDMYTASDGTEFSSGTTGRAYEQYLASLEGTAPVAPPADAAPAQTMDDLTSALDAVKDLDIGTGTRYKNKESDLTGVTYGDKKAFEYDLGEKYDNVVAVRSGNSVKFYKDGERLDRDETADALGLDSLNLSGESGNDKIRALKNQLRNQEVQKVYDQFGGEDSELVSQYLKDQAAARRAQERKEERKDEREAARNQRLRDQVKTEAERLFPGDPNAVDKYYDLGNIERFKMAGQDIAEVFDPSLGPLTVPYARDDDPASPTFGQVVPQIDPENARNLGVLGDYQLPSAPDPTPDPTLPIGGPGTFAPGALPAAPVQDGSLTLSPDMVTPEGDRFGDLIPQAVAQGVGPGEELAFTQNALASGAFKDEGSPPEEFIQKLASFESGTPGQIGTGDYQSVNELGYSGLLQFGQPRLDDYNRENNTDIQLSEFVQDNDLQDKVNLWHIGDIDKAYDALDPIALAETGIDRDGFRAAAHLGGVQGATDFVNSGGQYNPSDRNKKSLAQYAEDLKRVEPEPVETAGLNFSLSDLNPLNFFGSAEAAPVPSDQLAPGYAEQLAQYGAGRADIGQRLSEIEQGLIYDPSRGVAYTPEQAEEERRAVAGIDEKNLIGGGSAILGSVISPVVGADQYTVDPLNTMYGGLQQGASAVGTTMEALGFDNAARALNSFAEGYDYGPSATSQFLNQFNAPIGFAPGEVDPSLAAATKEGQEGLLNFNYEKLPGAVLEQLPNLVAAIGTAYAAGKGALALGAGATTQMIASGVGAAIPEVAQILGPIAFERAALSGRTSPNASDWTYATTASLANGALNAIPVLKGGKIIAPALEGATETAQSVVQQLAGTGQVDPKQAVGEGIIATGTGVPLIGTRSGVQTQTGTTGTAPQISTSIPSISADAGVQAAVLGGVSPEALGPSIETPAGLEGIQTLDPNFQLNMEPGQFMGSYTPPSSLTPDVTTGGGISSVAVDPRFQFPGPPDALTAPGGFSALPNIETSIDPNIQLEMDLSGTAQPSSIPSLPPYDPSMFTQPNIEGLPSGLTLPSNVPPALPSYQGPTSMEIMAIQDIIQSEIASTGSLSPNTVSQISESTGLSIPEITSLAQPSAVSPALPNVGGTEISVPRDPGDGTAPVISGQSETTTSRPGDDAIDITPYNVVPVDTTATGIATIDPTSTAVVNPVIDPAATTTVTGDTGTDTTTTVVGPPGTATTVVVPEEEVEVVVDDDAGEDDTGVTLPEGDDDKPPFECPDGFTAVKVDGQFVCMPDEKEDDGAGTVIQRVRPRIGPYYQPKSVAALSGYTPYRPR